MELNVVTIEPNRYACHEVATDSYKRNRIAKAIDPQLERIREEIIVGKGLGFVIYENGTIRFCNRVCVPAVEEFKKKILDEGHNTLHSINLGRNKLYKDLNKMF